MNNLVDKKELIKLSENIQQSIDTVDYHKKQLDSYVSPEIKTSSWNVLGLVTDTKVNEALNNITKFICKTFNLSSTIHNFHNEHIQKICELIGLISLAEVELYKKQSKLSENDVKAINKIKSLYEKYKKIDCSNDLNKQRITKLVELTHALSEFRTDNFNSLKQNVDENSEQLSEFKLTLDGILKEIQQLKQDFSKLQKRLMWSFVISGIATVIAAFSFAF